MPEANTFDPAVLDRLEQLRDKYAAMGQDLVSYLDGLLHADFPTYWDYINLDTLLSLQHPVTPFPDEEIFIIYHQTTELYFKLSLHELRQLHSSQQLSGVEMLERVRRVNRYFQVLVDSFDVMVDGLDRQQFLKFRMSLLPSSGFQSVQYRLVELACTSMDSLVHIELRPKRLSHSFEDVEAMFDELYWRRGATELATGKPTLTLKQFEAKYRNSIIAFAEERFHSNVRRQWQDLPESEQTPELREALRSLDELVNVHWPLSHYRSAVRHLQKDPVDIAATGGTNWQKYLPPRFQKLIFFPELWSPQETADWGKKWVMQNMGHK
ncbi:MAG: tryptophan 2,3-dioxygenase family protein [Flavobacteriales bacterium]|jgi:tryptophan 2,3-dioxygenase|nr:tryptophan 2,3-dioxygenase family protein [Flavobacteriales bacterium]